MVDVSGNKVYTQYMNTQRTISLAVAVNPRRAVQAFEGPSKAQVAKLRKTMAAKKVAAQEALTEGNDELAFTLDCLAFDIECTLRDYGYEVA